VSFVRQFRESMRSLPAGVRAVIWILAIGPSLLLVPTVWFIITELRRGDAILKVYGVALEAGVGKEAIQAIEPALVVMPSLTLVSSVALVALIGAIVAFFCMPSVLRRRRDRNGAKEPA
jgi:hypothetical protein